MNLNLDVERINDISFNGKLGSIDIDIPQYEVKTLLDNIPIDDILNYLDDSDLIGKLEDRGYKVV